MRGEIEKRRMKAIKKGQIGWALGGFGSILFFNSLSAFCWSGESSANHPDLVPSKRQSRYDGEQSGEISPINGRPAGILNIGKTQY